MIQYMPPVRISWHEPHWDGDPKSLVTLLLQPYGSSALTDKEVCNFTLYGALLYSQLWKERSSMLHGGVKERLA